MINDFRIGKLCLLVSLKLVPGKQNQYDQKVSLDGEISSNGSAKY